MDMTRAQILAVPKNARLDPRLQKVVDRVVQVAEVALERVVANHLDPAHYPLPADPKVLETVLKRRFDQLAGDRKSQVVANLRPRIGEKPTARKTRLGPLATLDLRAPASVVDQAKALPAFKIPPIPENELKQIAEDLQRQWYPGLAVGQQIAQNAPAAPTAKSLELHLTEVNCIQPTRLELGKDEIALGGILIDEHGEAKSFGPLDLGEYKAGKKVAFSPPKSLANISLTSGAFPKAIAVVPLLAEVDQGDSFIQDFVSILAGLVGLGFFVHFSVAVIITLDSFLLLAAWAVFAMAGAVLGLFVLFGYLIKDELFEPPANAPIIILPTNSARFPNGSTVSPSGEIKYDDFGADYRLKFEFKLKT